MFDQLQFKTGLPTLENFLCYRMPDTLEVISRIFWNLAELLRSKVKAWCLLATTLHCERKTCLIMESTQRKGKVEGKREKDKRAVL